MNEVNKLDQRKSMTNSQRLLRETFGAMTKILPKKNLRLRKRKNLRLRKRKRKNQAAKKGARKISDDQVGVCIKCLKVTF